MNTRTIHKIALSLVLGGTLSVDSVIAAPTPGIDLKISQTPLSVGTAGSVPNIMLMLDNSGSMTGELAASGTVPTPSNMPSTFTAANFSCSRPIAVPTSGTDRGIVRMEVSSGTVRFLTAGIDSRGRATVITTDFDGRNNIDYNCFNNTTNYTIRYLGSNTAAFTNVRGLNLNWYFSRGFFPNANLTATAFKTTRMEMAKNAAITLVNGKKVVDGEKAKIRLGLTTFADTKWAWQTADDGALTGGKLLVEVKDLDTLHAKTITDIIGTASIDRFGNYTYTGMQPDGYTSLAETLADIGRYFCRIDKNTPLNDTATKLTLYPTGTTVPTGTTIEKTVAEIFSTSSPDPTSLGSYNNDGLANVTVGTTAAAMQNYCQKSAVILVTDGLPNRDREIGQYLRDYSRGCSGLSLCDATPTSEADTYNASEDQWVARFPTGFTMSKTATSGTCTGDQYNKACKNGTLAGTDYEKYGSDYLDDVAHALYDMDLRPASTWSNPSVVQTQKDNGAKNNVRTYAIGIADPSVAVGSILERATKKSEGKYVFASDYAGLADALDKMVIDIQKGVGSFSAIPANSSSLGVDTALFQAKYDTADWTGDFLALPLSVNEDTNKNGKLDTGEDTNSNSQLDRGGDVGDPAWNAGNKFPVWNLRTIYTYHSTKSGVKLDCINLAQSQKDALGISTGCATTDEGVKRLNWLRGDISYEKINDVRKATYTTDPRLTDNLTPDIFRNRARFYGAGAVYAEGTIYKKEDGTPVDAWLLGDIVNSDAVYVSNEDYGYAGKSASIPEAGTNGATYKTFVDAKTDATSKKSKYMMTYVGANDGYLHGFDARIPPLSSGVRTKDPLAGQELLAYMPNTVFSLNTAGQYSVRNLSAPDYTHQYFVDGSPKVSDVYFSSDSKWHTVLVGTTGAGGKGVFALDITNPGTFATANPVLWEISNTDAPKAADITEFATNMGYSLPQPSIGRMANGKWAAIVANGYASGDGSTNGGKAVLYIIDIQTGNIIKTIDTGEGSATLKNGLSTPFAADVNQDGIIDAIYAGDLLGNMWKFDVSNKTASQWDVAYKKSGKSIPLFTACFNASSDATCDASRQAITNKPQVGKVGSTQTPGDVMVYFGTGKYFEDSDNDILNTKTQSFYGIWDKCPLGGSGILCSTTVPKSTLVKQTIMAELTSPANIRVTSPNTVDYSTKNGWYMDFEDPNSTTTPKANKGERIVSASLLRGGRIIFVTLIPTPDTTATTDVCIAGSKSESWLMEMDALSGARLKAPALDINGSGTVTDEDTVSVMVDGVATDVPASGVKMKGGSTKTPAVINNPGSDELKFTGSSSGEKPGKIAERPSSTSTSGSERQSWRQL
ncbi:MAG: PilC/PilY family type IV pilus protein [Methylococcales bacterium]|nr:PilC/PilY family type IV pilus protein [Methylococcales bacterium]